MAIELDLKNYKSLMSDRVAPGTYRVQIEDIDATDTTREGKPQMLVSLRVMDGPEEGSVLVERLPLDPTSKAMFRTVGFLTAMGVPTPRKRIRFDEQRLVGRKLMVEVVDNEWNGRVSSQVQSWLRVAKQADAGGDLDSLDTEEEAVARPAEEAPAPAAPEEKAVVPETTDEDIDLDEIDL